MSVHRIPAWAASGATCYGAASSALLGASDISRAPRRARTPRISRSSLRASGLAAGSADTQSAAAARKRLVRETLERNAPRVLDDGWGALVRWREPLLARDVCFETPFLPDLHGRACTNLALQMHHMLTMWRSLSASVHDVRVTSPLQDTLALVYELRIPVEVAGVDDDDAAAAVAAGDTNAPYFALHVRTVLRFDTAGHVVRWGETWSASVEDVLDRVWRLEETAPVRHGNFVVRVETNTKKVESPEVEAVCRAHIDDLRRFLVHRLPQLSLLGTELDEAEMDELYKKYFTDNGALTASSH